MRFFRWVSFAIGIDMSCLTTRAYERMPDDLLGGLTGFLLTGFLISFAAGMFMISDSVARELLKRDGARE